MDGSNDPIPVPEDSAQDQSQNGMRTEESGSGIQPSHIREALRRLNVPSGPLVPLAVSGLLSCNLYSMHNHAKLRSTCYVKAKRYT